jgi:hypothetical protein
MVTKKTENTEIKHPDPAHNESKTDDEYDCAPSIGGSLLMSDVNVTHESPDWTHNSHSAHSETDNRPKFYAINFIQRIN